MARRRIVRTLAAISFLLIPATQALAEEDDVPTPITGRQLMSQQEQEQYRAAMQALQTQEERAALRARHQAEMRARAQAQGVELPEAPGPRGPRAEGAPAAKAGQVRGRDLMTAEEREEHRREMRSKVSAEEREKAREKHHEEMKERAQDRGVELPDRPMPRGGAAPGRGGRR